MTVNQTNTIYKMQTELFKSKTTIIRKLNSCVVVNICYIMVCIIIEEDVDDYITKSICSEDYKLKAIERGGGF